MPLRHLTRLLAAAVLAAGAAPVLAQTADLAVTLELDGDFDTSTTPATATPETAGFTLGSEETYTVTVKNNSNLIVTGFTVNANVDAALADVSVTDCEATGTTAFPCKWTGTLAAGKSTTLTIAGTYAAPDPLNPGTATCPNGSVDVVSSVTVSAPTQASTALTDPDGANDTASYSAKLRNWADLEVSTLDSVSGDVGEGQTVPYTATVKNLGPCDAPNVRLSFSPAASLAYADGTATGCTNGAGSSGSAFGVRNRCELGTLAKDATQTVSASYVVNSFPSSTTEAAVTMDASIASRTVDPVVGADDPNADNDSASASNRANIPSSGCSTGGAGGLLGGLVALAGLRFRRRRA